LGLVWLGMFFLYFWMFVFVFSSDFFFMVLLISISCLWALFGLAGIGIVILAVLLFVVLRVVGVPD